MESKNRLTLMSFVHYCATHPNERFWQALRNWSGARFVLAVYSSRIASDFIRIDNFDTFYREGK